MMQGDTEDGQDTAEHRSQICVLDYSAWLLSK